MRRASGGQWTNRTVACAVKLRRRGRSFNEIVAVLGVPKATLHYWLSDVKLPAKAKRRLARRARDAGKKGIAAIFRKSKTAAKQSKNEAEGQWKRWQFEPLFMLGVGLYWGEGTKVGTAFSITNADEYVHLVFLRWLRVYAPELKTYGQLTVHKKHQRQAALNHWRKILGNEVPLRVYVATTSASKRQRPKHKLLHGTLSLRVGTGAAHWSRKMERWLELAKTCPTGESNPSFPN